MSRTRQESMDGICTVCSEVMEIYSVGQCDHVICFKCSTRMRVLCQNFECPICRSEIPQVYFARSIQPFRSINLKKLNVYKKDYIYFENNSVKDAFYNLKSHKCSQGCNRDFSNFDNVRDHMKKEHNLHYCDICVTHLKIFTHERKLYDRKQLAEHRRKGDVDDLSHKGHPLCQFCEERFLDSEELFRHLRKEHYYCHFCDADGFSNEYYGHFRASHYLCEEEECFESKFTHAFRTDIDLLAHKAKEHGKDRKKNRQGRAIDIEVNLVPRETATRGRRSQGGVSGRVSDGQRHRNERETQRAKARQETESALALAASLAEAERIGGNVSVVDRALLHPTLAEGQRHASSDEDEFDSRVQDFPTIAGSASEASPSVSPKPDRHTMANRVAMGSNFSVQHGEMDNEAFPTLPQGEKPKKSRKQNNNSSTWGKQPNLARNYNDEFPNFDNREAKKATNTTPMPHAAKQSAARASPQRASAAPPARPSSATAAVVTKSESSPNPKSSGNSASRMKTTAKSLGETLFNSSSSSGSIVDDPFPSLHSIGSSLMSETVNVATQPQARDRRHESNSSPLTWGKQPVVSKEVPKAAASQKPVAEPVTIRVNQKKTVSNSEEEYPSLGGITAPPTAACQWVTGNTSQPAHDVRPAMKVNKGRGKGKKVATPPSPPSSSGWGEHSGDQASWNLQEAELKRLLEEVKINEAREKEMKEKAFAATNEEPKKKKRGKQKGQKQKGTINLDTDKLETTSKESSTPSKIEEKNTGGSTKPMKEASANVTSQKDVGKEQEVKTATVIFKNQVNEPQGDTISVTSSVPPGFNNAAKLGAPPPGFSLSGASKTGGYIKPPKFQERNQKLITFVQVLLKSLNDGYDRFKSASGKFRKSELSATDYYSECRDVLGERALSSVFSELIVLLPDIAKQQELLKAYEAAGYYNTFERCSLCGQILLASDYEPHKSAHLGEDEFPSLSLATPSVTPLPFNAWPRLAKT